jgi:lipopolysaccharide export system protein LptA
LIHQRYSYKLALFISAFFLIPNIQAQNNVLELLPGSEKLGYDELKGVHRLVGTVNFNYQGNTMYCDSAHYSDKTSEVWAYGNVHITKNDINLFCDSLYYNGKQRIAKLWGHVRARDLEYKLTTDTLEYDAKKTQALYRNGGRIESIMGNDVLTSKIGYFHPNTKDFFVRDKVYFRNQELTMYTDTIRFNYRSQTTYFFGPTRINRKNTRMYCERGWYQLETEEGSLQKNASILSDSRYIGADTLFYQPKQGLSTAKGHVICRDSTENIEFFAGYAVNSETNHYTLLTSNPLAKKIQEKDTVYICADTLFSQQDENNKHLFSKGFHHVTIFNASMQAMCDSISFNRGELKLLKKPIVWSHNAELKGDTIHMLLNDSVLEKIHIHNNATVIMEVDSGNYYNQIAGKEIDAYFNNSELVRSEVNGNAKTIFFPLNEEKTDSTVVKKRLGMNRLIAGNIRILIDRGEIAGITYFEKPDGVFYPMDQLKKEEQFLTNFEWNAELRPKRWQALITQP